MAEATILRQLLRQGEGASKRRPPPGTVPKPTFTSAKPFRIKTKDGAHTIPFRAGTDPERAKEWTRNYLTPTDKFEFRDFETSDDGTKSYQINHEYGLLVYDDDPKTGAYHVSQSKVIDEMKGKGFGAGMYRQLFEKAKKENRVVYSDSIMSNSSIAVWRRLKELGYPIQEDLSSVTDIKGGEYTSARPMFKYDPKGQ